MVLQLSDFVQSDNDGTMRHSSVDTLTFSLLILVTVDTNCVLWTSKRPNVEHRTYSPTHA